MAPRLPASARVRGLGVPAHAGRTCPLLWLQGDLRSLRRKQLGHRCKPGRTPPTSSIAQSLPEMRLEKARGALLDPCGSGILVLVCK